MQPGPPRRSSIDALKLQRENATLAIKLLKVNSELRIKQIYCERLEYLLRQRAETIDELNGKLEQSREQVRRLGLENEVLAAMIAAPPVNASILVQTIGATQAPGAPK